MPENPSVAWSYIEEHNQDKFIYRLGNITPIEKKANRNMGNQSYNEKVNSLRESCFQITASIPEHYEQWNEKAIESRQTQMAKKATAIWRIILNPG